MKFTFKPFFRLSVFIGLALVALVAFLILRESQSNDDLSPEAYDFAIADTASIDRIVLWNRSPDTAILTRESGIWLINGAHPARPDAIEVLLETLGCADLRPMPPPPIFCRPCRSTEPTWMFRPAGKS